MFYLFTVLWDQVWSVIKLLLGSSIVGVIGVKIWEKQKNKKREGLEIIKLSLDGENSLNILKTNIKKEVEEKTQALNQEIEKLNSTIVRMSVKHTVDLDASFTRMGELEQRLDAHRDRADKIEERSDRIEKQKIVLETNLDEEIKLRKACIKQLEDLQHRVFDLEVNASQPSSPIITNNTKK